MEQFFNTIVEFFRSSGIAGFLADGGWKNLIMIAIGCVLLFLAIKKDFEPYLLVPIAFGMILVNLPFAGKELLDWDIVKYTSEDVAKNLCTEGQIGNINWNTSSFGLIGFLQKGLPIYPCLIFLCIGATTDFGPLIANKKTMLLGAAAQIGIFATFIGAIALGFTPAQASSIGIIGGADGPTAILVTNKLAPDMLGTIAVVAYSYMALVPIIQPPIIRLLTTKKERQIKMETPREVSKTEKILFPIIVTIITVLLVPSCAPLIGCLMLGNLVKESGVVPNITKTLSNGLMYTVTIILGVCVGAKTDAGHFLANPLQTLEIFGLGIAAFSIATAAGVLGGKLMCVFTRGKVNPMIGAAGVSAVPMAARVVHKEGVREDPTNFLLMHAMGPNVAGVIGSAVAAGVLLLLFL